MKKFTVCVYKNGQKWTTSPGSPLYNINFIKISLKYFYYCFLIRHKSTDREIQGKISFSFWQNCCSVSHHLSQLDLYLKMEDWIYGKTKIQPKYNRFTLNPKRTFKSDWIIITWLYRRDLFIWVKMTFLKMISPKCFLTAVYRIMCWFVFILLQVHNSRWWYVFFCAVKHKEAWFQTEFWIYKFLY